MPPHSAIRMRAADFKNAAVMLLCAAAVCISLLATGCGSLESQFGEAFRPRHKADPRELAKHQKQYQASRSKRAMRWLLANAVTPGMTRAEVEGVLGEEGVREINDRWLKTKGDTYRLDDVIYCFGPDDAGNCVYLGFRDDQLINFEPEEFGDASGPKSRKRDKKQKTKKDKDEGDDEL